MQDVAARIVERQREAEGAAFADFRDALKHLLGRDQVEPSNLVIGAELAPIRSGWPVTSTA